MDTKALRQKILDLAIRGKLVPQDPDDEPASVLLERIRAEKRQMVKDGKLKPKDIENDTAIFRGGDNYAYEKFPDGKVKCIQDEIPFDLPEGWEWTRLGQIGDWASGATPRRTNKEYYSGDIPWLKTGDLNDGYIHFVPESVSTLALKNVPLRINPVGTVLIAMYGATIGKVGILSIEATTNQACCACIPILTNNKYIFYFLMSHRENFIRKAEGGAQPNISKEKIVNTLIPLPPLSEQERIVSKLNEIFSVIDAIESEKSDLQKTITLTKTKILDLAIRGKLVPQDPDDEPANALLDRVRAEKEELIRQGKIKRDNKETVIFKGEDNSYYDELPNNWSVANFSQLNLFQSSSVNPMNEPEEFFELYSVPNFELSVPEIKKGKEINSSKKAVCDNDVLLCKINPRINRVWIVNHITDYKMIASSEWIVFRNNYLYAPYVCVFFSSGFFRDLMQSNVSGVGGSLMRAQPDSVKKYPMVIPPLGEQKRIADKVSQLFSLLDSIAESIN